METYDVIVIGAGPAGEVIAGRLGEAGESVALVEQHLVGGECSFYACMPSKALLRPAEALREVRRVPGAAEAVTGNLDVDAVIARRDEVIHNLDDSSMLPWLEQRNVTLIRGRGTIRGEKLVGIKQSTEKQSTTELSTPQLSTTDSQEDTTTIRAKKAVVIATGSENATPPIEGLAEAKPWSNREATTTKHPPKSLLVLGGGPVGVELAQAWRTLGSKVTLVEGNRHLLPREEEFACEQVTEALEKIGVDVRCGAAVTKVNRENGVVTAELDDGSTVEGEEVLAALGRKPVTKGLGLLNIGIPEDDSLKTDANMCVIGHPWLYAIGDVNGKVLLTHMGKYQARVAAEHILGRTCSHPHGADGPLSPRVTFTDPQVAAAGHTLKSAKEAGLRVHAKDAPTSGNAGGSFYGRGAPGTARIVVDEDRNVIVGATITGSEIADFIHAATIAIVGEVPLSRLWHAVPSFPTRSELWLKLLENSRKI